MPPWPTLDPTSVVVGLALGLVLATLAIPILRPRRHFEHVLTLEELNEENPRLSQKVFGLNRENDDLRQTVHLLGAENAQLRLQLDGKPS